MNINQEQLAEIVDLIHENTKVRCLGDGFELSLVNDFEVKAKINDILKK